MFGKRLRDMTSLMIYVGTLLVSIFSFFTTYSGLAIFLPNQLALLGSAGLQLAMLGVAWNLMRFKQNRTAYISVFSVASLFSVFFSYANFNISLKEETRSLEARANFSGDAIPAINEYARLSKAASNKGAYQLSRTGDLLRMEQDKGWATVVDEGSNDIVVQSIIDGARRTVLSWKEHQGTGYRQGKGSGIISNYLETESTRLMNNLETVNTYVGIIDSFIMQLDTKGSVKEQYDIVNLAYLKFPVAEIGRIEGGQLFNLPTPPSPANYIEKATNGQQALMLVIQDLYPIDNLTFFSLMFALVIDLIVIVLAISGSQMIDEMDIAFTRAEAEVNRKVKKLQLSDPVEFERSLNENVQQLRAASRYGEHIGRVKYEFEEAKKRVRMTKPAKIKPEVPTPTSLAPVSDETRNRLAETISHVETTEKV